MTAPSASRLAVIKTGPAILSFFSNGEVICGRPQIALAGGAMAVMRIASMGRGANTKTEPIAQKLPVD
jgi:hypothetical protein